MTALPHNIRDLGYNGLRLSADEYLALGETEDRYELIHGTVVMMSPSPLPRHNEVLLEVAHQFKLCISQGCAARVLVETDVRLSADTVYRPDVVVYRAGRLPAGAERLDSPPDLVVEVLSRGTKPLDLITKRNDYDAFGVGEYWVVDPTTGHTRCWKRQGTRLEETPVNQDIIRCGSVVGLTLDLAQVRRIIADS